MELDQISVTPGWWSDVPDEPMDIAEDEIELPFALPHHSMRVENYAHGILLRQGPSISEWLGFKETIVELYAKERRNLKLWEVQDIMQKTFGFGASTKQYKDKFKAWGIRKNERRQRPEQKSATDQRRRDSNTTAFTTETTDTDVTMEGVIAPAVRSPLRLAQGQRTLTKLLWYLESRLFSGGVMHFFGPVKYWQRASIGNALFCHPAQLNSNYSRAMVLTRRNCPRPAFALFSRTTDIMESLFSGEHPALTPCILDAFLEHIYDSNPQSRTVIIDQAIEAARQTPDLGPSHPITELCKLLQVPLDAEEEVDHLLWFCEKFCDAFSKKLTKRHRIAVHINLRYFQKLLQMNKFELAQAHLQNYVEPAFLSESGKLDIKPGLKEASLCYLRRKAFLCRSLNDLKGAHEALKTGAQLLQKWLSDLASAIAGNPLIEETFRMLDEYAHLLYAEREHTRAIDVHAFALELCIAVRGKQDGKTMRMIAGHAQFCHDTGMIGQEEALLLRFPEVFADADSCAESLTTHRLPCENCANGQDTQNFCEAHRRLPGPESHDRSRVQAIQRRLRAMFPLGD